MRSLKVIFTLFLVNFTAGNCYKILTILPTPFKSHAIIGESVVKQLARAGHEVTLISSFRLEEVNVKNVVIRDVPDGRYIECLCKMRGSKGA
jgi:predicted CoA-binding protein